MKLKFNILVAGLAMIAGLASCNVTGSYETKEYVKCSFEMQSFLKYYPDSIYTGSDPIYWEVMQFDKFGMSMLCDTSYAEDHTPTSKYSVADTTAAERSTLFAFTAGGTVNFVPGKLDNATCSPFYVFVANTNYMVHLAKYGIDGIPAFQRGDELTVNFIGKRYGNNTKTISQKLIFYDGNGLSYLHDWTLVKLSDMGSVTSVDVTLTSNRSDLPGIVCIDDMNFYVTASN